MPNNTNQQIIITPIATDNAPTAVGPYSQAICHNGIVYASGQIALLPNGDKTLADGIQAQTAQVLRNLSAVLEAAGSDTKHILKANIFLVDMDDFPLVNNVYAEWLGNHRPARATVAVTALPLGARIEIDVVAAQCPH
ncbi:MAG: Rid family detoxifying hydrolase [Mariprofundales bacterium]